MTNEYLLLSSCTRLRRQFLSTCTYSIYCVHVKKMMNRRRVSNHCRCGGCHVATDPRLASSARDFVWSRDFATWPRIHMLVATTLHRCADARYVNKMNRISSLAPLRLLSLKPLGPICGWPVWATA